MYNGNNWFYIGPSACNWIIGDQDSHENALQAGWASNTTVCYKKDTTSIAVSVNFMENYSECTLKSSTTGCPKDDRNSNVPLSSVID